MFAVSGILFSTTYLTDTHPLPNGIATITGTVTDAGTGTPLFGCVIQLNDSKGNTITDASGKYTISNLAPGYYTVSYIYAGYDTLTTERFRLLADEEKTIDIQMKHEYVQADKGKKVHVNHQGVSPLYINRSSVHESKSVIDYTYYQLPDDIEEPFNTEAYNAIHENGFKKTIGNPLSTFSIDVDNASYSNIRRYISYGQAPPVDAVRIEEMINYFDYAYPAPTGADPFSINMEISDCPWNKENKLVMIGLQGKDIDYSQTNPSNLVFLIDVSGSMQDANKLGLVKKALHVLVDNLRSEDKIALVVYAGAAGLVLPSTAASQKQTIKDAINKLEAGGSTAGGEGIQLAYKVATDNFIKGGNNRVILCTDGDFNVGASSDADMTRLIEEKRTTGVFITVCGFGMGNYKDSKMEQIADNGNGNYYYIDAEKEAKKIFGAELKGTLFTIAKDVKIQVEFNPAKVEAYRLIGYENRVSNKEDFEDDKKDAGELGAGHRVTALYEVTLRSGNYVPSVPDHKVENTELKYQTTEVKPEAYYSNDILNLKLRYKNPDGDVSKLIEKSISDDQLAFSQTSDNFRFACAVTEFGMLLRNSEWKGTSSYEEVIQLAFDAKGTDIHGYRSEFIQMVQSYLSVAQK